MMSLLHELEEDVGLLCFDVEIPELRNDETVTIEQATLAHKCCFHKFGLCSHGYSTRQSVLISPLAGNAFVAKFDQDYVSSDGGTFLLQT